MSYTDSKKACLAVYEVLRKYTSWDCPISISSIIDKVRVDYGLDVSRNTVTDTLKKLREFYGDDIICCAETDRLGADGEENTYTYAYYFDRDEAGDILSDDDIAKLVDVCLYARNLTSREAKDLIKRLKGMATDGKRRELDYTDDIPEKQFNTNKKTSDNLRVLHKAISQNRGRNQQWVSFDFNYINENKQLVSWGKRYTVLPLRICEANHRYYLLCAMEGSEKKIYHYRIDLMTKLSADKRHPVVAGLKILKKDLNSTEISEYMSQHLYMFYDEPKYMELFIPKQNGAVNLTFLADAFGIDAKWRVIKDSDEGVTIGLYCSPDAMEIFVRQYEGRGIIVHG